MLVNEVPLWSNGAMGVWSWRHRKYATLVYDLGPYRIPNINSFKDSVTEFAKRKGYLSDPRVRRDFKKETFLGETVGWIGIMQGDEPVWLQFLLETGLVRNDPRTD